MDRVNPEGSCAQRILVVVAFTFCILVPGVCLAQAPLGTITGVVRDRSGGVIPGALVQAVSRATGLVRVTTAAAEGEYSFPALLPGEYELSVEAAGFQAIGRAATVEAGTTTRADLALRVGDVSDSVTVQGASPQIHFDSAAVGVVIVRDQIEGLPLSGRSFLELAKLEPGVQPPTAADRNRTVVPILGAPAANVGGARFTIDGGSVTSVGLGGWQIAFSQTGDEIYGNPLTLPLEGFVGSELWVLIDLRDGGTAPESFVVKTSLR